MKLIKKHDTLEKTYPICNSEGKKISETKLIKGKWIAAQNYILHERSLYPVNVIEKEHDKIKIG